MTNGSSLIRGASRKLSKRDLALLAEVEAGNVVRTGGELTGVATLNGRDVTVAAEGLRRQALVTLGRPATYAPARRTTSRVYVLMPAGRTALGGAS